jgi:hypothetical protein
MVSSAVCQLDSQKHSGDSGDYADGKGTEDAHLERKANSACD